MSILAHFPIRPQIQNATGISGALNVTTATNGLFRNKTIIHATKAINRSPNHLLGQQNNDKSII